MDIGGSRKKIEEIIEEAISLNATDIHISAGRPPVYRIDGQLTSSKKMAELDSESAKDLSFALLNDEKKDQFLAQKDVDLSYDYKEKVRFRINVYTQLGKVSAAMRMLPYKVRLIDELQLPAKLHEITKKAQGFFLVVGPAGQGKSTALAAMVEEINQERQDHIITIEDPIEYLFKQNKCIIDQREVGQDVMDFRRGLREAFRQDPDVIMIGEMRDPETISSAVTAAETGHLVLTTLHTNTAAQTIDRIIDSFPPHQQGQIRMQLAATILGILSRRLIPRIEGSVINAVELMLANTAIRSMIREGKTHQIDMIIETGSKDGMISLNRSLLDLVKNNEISREDAELHSVNPEELKMLMKKHT